MNSVSFYSATPLWEDLIPGGHHFSARIRRGTVLKLTALAPVANAAFYCVNSEEKLERFNMPDSLKAQHTAFLSTGHVLYSDMGRVMASIIADDHGWNDVFCAPSTAEQVIAQYGAKTFQAARNAMYRNGRESLLIEMAKYGLAQQDLSSTVNLFSKVTPNADGQLHYEPSDCTGQAIALRFEMDCLVFLSNTPHALNPSTDYQAADLQLQLFPALALAEHDICRDACPQNQRGFANNARYYGVYSDVAAEMGADA